VGQAHPGPPIATWLVKGDRGYFTNDNEFAWLNEIVKKRRVFGKMFIVNGRSIFITFTLYGFIISF
jgi:hypothetical protein